jgi:predicted ester cyclase
MGDAHRGPLVGGATALEPEALVGSVSRTARLHPLAALLRRYAFAYTATHDFDVCDHIMVDDYVLRMGPHVIRGRDAAYKPATAAQYRQFPGLGFTIHDLLLNGDRAALCFSEHGRSARTGTGAVWRGISMYRWDGSRLVECRVEQDYLGRRRQLDSGVPDPLPSPAVDPWTAGATESDAAVEAAARAWLEGGALLSAAGAVLDTEDVGHASARCLLDAEDIEILDLLSAGPRIAFHLVVRGQYSDGLPRAAEHVGARAELFVCGMGRVAGSEVEDVRAVSDRLGLERRLRGEVR